MPPSFSVTGGRALKGTIRPAGNKNAALPILAATLLADGPCRIDNVPHIRDVETMLALLVHLGADVRWLGPNSVEVNTARAEPRELDPALCARIRASILLAGPMRSEEHTSELQSRLHLVCRLLLEKKKAAATAARMDHYLRSGRLLAD